MKHIRIPSKTDRGPSFESWCNVVRQIQKLTNIQFDPTKFWVIDSPNGMFISTYPQSSTSSTSANNHFQVATNSNSSSYSLDVHAGNWNRFFGPYREYIPMTINGGGKSSSYNDIKTVDISNVAATPQYIYLELNEEVNPTTLEVKVIAQSDPSVPTMGANTNILGGYKTQMIAAISEVVDGNSVSVSIEQLYSGDINQSLLVADTHDGATISDVETGTRKSLQVEQSDQIFGLYDFKTPASYVFTEDKEKAVIRLETDDGAELKYGEISEITVVTDIQYNSSTHTLEKKTKLVRVLSESNVSSDWTTITVAALCDTP